MLLTLEGKIARRVLVNFWADPAVVRRLVPAPLEVATHNGLAVVGVCLIRLTELRPKSMPAWMGITAENMAHRVAVRVPSDDGPLNGVFIWRRDTDCGLIAQVGGRLFPAVHWLARFEVTDSGDSLSYSVLTDSHQADVAITVSGLASNPVLPVSSPRCSPTLPAIPPPRHPFHPTNLFESLDDASRFFARGECGYSCALRDGALEGLRLRILDWQITPLDVSSARCAFFENSAFFPPGSVGFDSAYLMRDARHEWHSLTRVPELAGLST